jgi:DNA polymerase/3'-5' exonuclease PolX
LGAALERKVLNGLEIKQQAIGKRHIHRAASLLEAATRLELSRVMIAGDLRRGCELVANMALVAVAPVKSSSPGELEPVFEQCLPTLHNSATAGTRIRSENPQISALRGLIATGEVRIGGK